MFISYTKMVKPEAFHLTDLWVSFCFKTLKYERISNHHGGTVFNGRFVHAIISY